MNPSPGSARRVTIEPDEFKLVEFDRDELAALVEGLLDEIGLDRPVTLDIDQTSPLAGAEVASIDPIVLSLQSGALEDPKRIRKLSPKGAANVLGRLLLQVHDRLDPAFGPVPPDGEVSLAHATAWDVYAVGRLVRLGHTHYDERQRRLYQFRTRHGFSDVGDAAFEALWSGDSLTWADITRLSDEADARTRA